MPNDIFYYDDFWNAKLVYYIDFSAYKTFRKRICLSMSDAQ